MILDLLQAAPILAAWVGWFWMFREMAARQVVDSDWRLSWAFASLGWGTVVVLVSETTSIFRKFDPGTVLVLWVGVSVLLVGASWRMMLSRGGNWRGMVSALREGMIPSKGGSTGSLEVLFMVTFTAVFVLVLGGIALLTPTTNYDSLTYHMPRVMHWIQNGSVAQYATSNCRQNEFGPWSGYVLANLQLLCGTDRLANLVQWFAMLTSILTGSYLAQQFLGLLRGSEGIGASTLDNPMLRRRVAAMTAFLIVTLPIGIVESVTTQTDYTTTAWFVGLVLMLVLLCKEAGNIWYALGAGIALGLGVLSKVTTLIYAAPLIAWLGFWLLFRRRGRLLQVGSILVLVFGLINAPHMTRNLSLVGSPFSCSHISQLEKNRTVTFSGTLSNVIRNLALHTNTQIRPLTGLLNTLFRGAHKLTGRDLNDPEITYYAGAFCFAQEREATDSYASCSPHLLLLFIAVVAGLIRPRRDARLLGFIGLMAASFIIFCAVLRWQNWHSRLHLTYFVVLMPVCAVILGAGISRWLILMICLLPGYFGFQTLFHNRSRPILDRGFYELGRERQYAVMHGESYEPNRQVVDDVLKAGVKNVGLRLGFNDPEYLLWVMLQGRNFSGRIDHYMPADPSARLPCLAPPPQVVITSMEGNIPHDYTNGYPYRTSFGSLTILWSDAFKQMSKSIESR